MKRGELINKVQKRTQSALAQWGLKHNPFMKTPPPEHIRREVFTDRLTEMEMLIQAVLANPLNILVFGTYGIGKTIFVLESLSELSAGTKLLPIYTTLEGNKPADFNLCVLLALSNALRAENNQAEKIYNVLTGEIHSVEIEKEGGLQIESSNLLPVSVTVGGKGTKSHSVQRDAVPHPQHELEKLLDIAQKEYTRIIIGVDEIDKCDSQTFQALLAGVRATLDLECSFVLTGGLWAPWLTQNPQTSVYGAFGEEIKLEPFDFPTTREVIVAYLNSARHDESDTTSPFLEKTVEYIFQQSKGIPRQFNQLCYKAINGAMRTGARHIDTPRLIKALEEAGYEKYSSLQQNERYIVEVIRHHGGVLSDETLEALQELGASTVLDIYPTLEKLVQEDVLIKQEDTRTVRYELGPTLRDLRLEEST